VADLGAQKLQHVTGDLLRRAIQRIERRVAIGSIRLHYRDDLLRITAKMRHADAIRRMENLDWSAVLRQGRAVANVVHALHLDRLPRVHPEHHAVGQVEPSLVVTDRRGWDQVTVLGDARHLYQCDVEMPE